MKTFKNIVRNFFIISTIIGSAFTVCAQSSTRIYYDAEAFNLYGSVKSFSEKTKGYLSREPISISFNADGSIISDNEVFRNDDGTIDSYSYISSIDSNTIITLIWNWNGNHIYQISQSYYKKDIDYAENAYTVEVFFAEEGKIDFAYDHMKKIEYYFEFINYDEKGNWTECVCSWTEFDGGPVSYMTINREITYYE